ncbi:hypothetical protein Tco_0419338 [Tanacetum coccineum]
MAIIAISGRITCCQYSSDTLVDHGLKLGTGDRSGGSRVCDWWGSCVPPSLSLSPIVLLSADLKSPSVSSVAACKSAISAVSMTVSPNVILPLEHTDRTHQLIAVPKRHEILGLLLHQGEGQCVYGMAYPVNMLSGLKLELGWSVAILDGYLQVIRAIRNTINKTTLDGLVFGARMQFMKGDGNGDEGNWEEVGSGDEYGERGDGGGVGKANNLSAIPQRGTVPALGVGWTSQL